MTTLFAAVGGLDGLRALAHAWHERCLADPVAGHPFGHPGQHPDHLERLTAYWAEALGGPPLYTGAGLGDETHVRRLHAGNGEHRSLDLRVIACFDQAMADVGITDPDVVASLHDYFAGTTEEYEAYHESPDQVPDGLTLPHWPRG